MALIWQNMDAVDVAFTEAAVGAGISTVLLVGTLLHTRRDTNKSPIDWKALGVVTVTGAFLIYGTLDMPAFGDAEAPIHNGRVVELLGQRVGKIDPDGYHHVWTDTSMAEQAAGRAVADRPFPPVDHLPTDHPNDDFLGHAPNTVTSLLASYRGYDTMFEAAVIFTAGMAMVMLLRRREETA